MLAVLDQLLHKAEHLLTASVGLPVHPAGGVILTVAIIVAVLGSQQLIPHQQHGGADREQGRHHHVFGLAHPQGIDLRILGHPFMAMIPAEVVIATITVILAIRLIVLAVVAAPVPQGKTVVAGDEVNAFFGVCVVIVVDVGAAAQPLLIINLFFIAKYLIQRLN